MAVYREGYSIIESLQNQSVQIYPDACDFGVPVEIGDANWKALKQLTEWYGMEGHREKKALGVKHLVKLVDEWAVSDERKTWEEAIEIFQIEYTKASSKGSSFKFDGIVEVRKIK